MNNGNMWKILLIVVLAMMSIRTLANVLRTNVLRQSSIPKVNKVNNVNKVGLKVVTDIDDTVVSSGGLNIFGIALGGIDKQYKRKQFYPGVVQFALELSTNTKTNRQLEKGKGFPNRVSVLTARAREFKFALALKASSKLNKKYRKVGELNGFPSWGIGEVYYGSVREWIFQGLKGVRKFRNFEIMMNVDEQTQQPVGRYIIIGDTGEKDEEAGNRIATKYPEKVQAIFLHCVYPGDDRGSSSAVELPKDRKVNSVPVYYFKTYVGAAYKAYQSKLICKEGMKRVAEQAVKDLRSYDEICSKLGGLSAMSKFRKEKEVLKRGSRWKELKADIEAVPFLKSKVLCK